jgi:multiple sugar transport system substrate-binding protein
MKQKAAAAMLSFIVMFSSFIPLAGCRSGEGAKHLTLTIVSGVEGDALKQAALEYQKQKGVHIEIAQFPYSNLFEKELIDLSSSTGAYDLIMIDDPWFPRFASSGLLAHLGPLYQKRGIAGPDEDFVAASLALCRDPYETGSLYALPYVGNSQLFFYRRDLFEKHALKEPTTWDNVLQAARTISEREQAGSPAGTRVFGYVMRAAQGNAVVADFLPIFWAFGAEMFDQQGRPAVNSAEALAALDFMLELGKHAPPGYVSFNADEVSAHLLQGTAAMSINWPAWISAFSDPQKSKVIGKIGITTMPAARKPGQAEIGNWLIAIPAGARNKDAAFDFLLWATSAEQMKKSAALGNPPTRRSVFRDVELMAKFPSYTAQLRSLEASRPRPRTRLWNEIENTFGIFLSRANSGALSPQEALDQANDEIGKILERNKR